MHLAKSPILFNIVRSCSPFIAKAELQIVMSVVFWVSAKYDHYFVIRTFVRFAQIVNNSRTRYLLFVS